MPIDYIFKAGYLGCLVIQNAQDGENGDQMVLRDSISILNQEVVSVFSVGDGVSPAGDPLKDIYL